MTEVILTALDSLKLKNRDNFESVIFQLYKYTPNTLFCVKDGVELLLFKKVNKLPRNMTYEGNLDEMYFFREHKSESLFTIFGEEWYTKVQNFLNYKEEEIEVASVVKENSEYRESSRLSQTNTAKIFQSRLNI